MHSKSKVLIVEIFAKIYRLEFHQKDSTLKFKKNKSIESPYVKDKNKVLTDSLHKKISPLLEKSLSKGEEPDWNAISSEVKIQLKELFKEKKIPTKISSLFYPYEKKDFLCDSETGCYGRGATFSLNILHRGKSKKNFTKQIINVRHFKLFHLLEEQLRKKHLVGLQNALTGIVLKDIAKDKIILLAQVKSNSKNVIQGIKSLLDFFKHNKIPIVGASMYNPGKELYVPLDDLINTPYKKKHFTGPESLEVKGKGFYHNFHSLESRLPILDAYPQIAHHLQLAFAKCEEVFCYHAESGSFSFNLGEQVKAVTTYTSNKFFASQIKTNLPPKSKLNVSSYTFYNNVERVEEIASSFTEELKTGLLIQEEVFVVNAAFYDAFKAFNWERVVHITYNTDKILELINKWRKLGYLSKKIVPIILTPSASQILYVLVFARDHFGLLNNKHKKKSEKQDSQDTNQIRFVQQ